MANDHIAGRIPARLARASPWNRDFTTASTPGTSGQSPVTLGAAFRASPPLTSSPEPVRMSPEGLRRPLLPPVIPIDLALDTMFPTARRRCFLPAAHAPGHDATDAASERA